MAHKVGIIDLDTSHPGAFAGIMKDMADLDLVTVFDRGAVHDPGYADEFAEKHGVPDVANSMEDLIGKVDIVFVQSTNWDDHLKPARLAIEAVKVLIAAKVARQTGRTIALEDLTIDDGFDGTPFIKEYRTKARTRT